MGASARVTLFGSRVADNLNGGDVDLLVEVPEKVPVATEIALHARLAHQLGEPVDIITATPEQRKPIVEIARKTGVRL